MKGYQSYRGRVPMKRKVAVAVMIVLLLLCGTYLALSEYAEFQSEGGHSFRLPWSGGEAGGEESDGPEDPEVDLVIEEPEDPLQEMRAVELSAEELRQRLDDDGWWEREGYNAVCVRLKESDGLLRYESEAAPAELIAGGALRLEELRQLLEKDVYAVARICCFHDSACALADMAGKGLCQSSGYIWYDAQNTHWLDPGKEEARAYLVSLCAELAELGFDEIVLDEASYPTAGKLSKSSPVSADKAAQIEGFVSEVGRVLEEKKVRLGLVVKEETLLAGGDETAGWELSRLLTGVNRVYVRAADGDAAEQALRALSDTAMLVRFDAAEGNRCTVRP
ncbi:MAG: putative glycoside hydrolase [Oscillospiraceae bacterium]